LSTSLSDFFFSSRQVAIDSIFFGSCLSISTFFELLRDNFDGDVKKFVQGHTRLLEIAEDLNSLYQPIILAQLFLTNFLLCMIGTQLVLTNEILGLITSAPFGIAALSQLFMYCYGGQVIEIASASLAADFYQLDKRMTIVIAKVSKGFQMKAFIYQANLPTFRMIISSAQGMITFLKSFA
jgi:odorant receptor